MDRAELTRKLRSLRRLERSVRCLGDDDPAPLWREFFAFEPGSRVRYPFAVLLAFDRPSRERAFREFLLRLWAAGQPAPEGESADLELMEMLGLEASATPDEVRRTFRRLAKELHPDLGGDEELIRELIDRYRDSSYGGRPS